MSKEHMMMKLLFRDLYIFAPGEKSARRISFQPGINIVTSSKTDGTNRGKSVVMRSLYHALGAEARFEANFAVKDKVFILRFQVDDKEYYIYRAANLYKVFNEQKQVLFTATKARDLAENLRNIFHFAVMLPERNSNKLEITPPAYNYLPFFLDQDRYEGSTFKSFKHLEQYPNYKDNVLFYHFDVYTTEYFNLVRKKEELSDSLKKIEDRIRVLNELLWGLAKRIDAKAYSKDIEALRRDVSQYRQRYSEIVQNLNSVRDRLVNHRNSLYDFQTSLKELSEFEKKNENGLKKLRANLCPECDRLLEDSTALKSRRYNISDDIITVKNGIQVSIQELEAAVAKEETQYQELLARLKEYEKVLRINTSEINDVLKYKGLCELREDIASEHSSLQEEEVRHRIALAEVEKEIKTYGKKKKSINENYYRYLMDAKTRFGLDEIPPDCFKNISAVFTASGSDKYIATVIWYLTIIKLRNQFNPEAIQFPIVFDSPNNVENDEEKTNELIAYLLENAKLSPQFVMSGIGFEDEKYKDTPNIIMLSTPRFQLLQKDEYERYSPLLAELCNAQPSAPQVGNAHEEDEQSD